MTYITIGSIEWATHILRYAISAMFGGNDVIVSTPSGRIQLAEYFKIALEHHGYTKMAKTLTHQINRYKKQLKEENLKRKLITKEEPKPVTRNAKEVKLHEFLGLPP